MEKNWGVKVVSDTVRLPLSRRLKGGREESMDEEHQSITDRGHNMGGRTGGKRPLWPKCSS
jgi:hypothetical protein